MAFYAKLFGIGDLFDKLPEVDSLNIHVGCAPENHAPDSHSVADKESSEYKG
jgi:hypothetical protein